MADQFTLTGWLIMAFGLYSMAAGFGMAMSADRFRQMFEEMERSPALNFVIGLLVFAIGVTILLIHPSSTRWPDILVAIMGWGAAVEGLLFLAAPQVMWAIARPFMKSGTKLWGYIALALGIALAIIGWFEVERTTVIFI